MVFVKILQEHALPAFGVFLIVFAFLMGFTFSDSQMTMTKDERQNDPAKFAKVVLTTAFVLAILCILGVFFTAKQMTESSSGLAFLIFIQMIYLTLSASVFTFVITNVTQG